MYVYIQSETWWSWKVKSEALRSFKGCTDSIGDKTTTTATAMSVHSMIQSLLASIASLGWPVQVVTLIMGDDGTCPNILFNNNFLDSKCLSLALSKALGIIMTVLSCFFKVPIIMNMLSKKSGEGMSLVSLYLENSAHLVVNEENIIQAYFHHSTISFYFQPSVISVTTLFHLLTYRVPSSTATLRHSPCRRKFVSSWTSCHDSDFTFILISDSTRSLLSTRITHVSKSLYTLIHPTDTVIWLWSSCRILSSLL